MKKACDKYNLSDSLAYLQNKMSREEESKFQFHMMSCAHCQRRVKMLRHVANIFSVNKLSSQRVWLMAASVAVIVGGSLTMWRATTGGDGSMPINYDAPNALHSSEEEFDTAIVDTTKMESDSLQHIIDSLKRDSLIQAEE